MRESNPFLPTTLDAPDHAQSQSGIDFIPILHRWEKLRLWYNAILITLTLVWSAILSPELLLDPLFLFQIGLGGLITNLCFFTGPAIEAYGRYFGIWNVAMSLAMFTLGLMFTSALTIGFLIVRAR